MMRTPHKLKLSVTATTLASFAALWLCSHANAVSTRVFRIDTGAEFAAGELLATRANSVGNVQAGVGVRRIGLPDAQVASSFARAPNGDLYVGTGQDGRIFRVRGDSVSLFAETEQLLVSALTIGADGLLYAGTLPEGRIFRINADGELSELAQLQGAEHIWDLVWDPQREVLFAATGPLGQIFTIDERGEAEVFYDSDHTHIMCLDMDESGRLYAGTNGDALLLRLSAPGRVEVLHDFPGNEVTALDVSDGLIAVAANEFPPAVTPLQTKAGPRPLGRTVRRPRPGKGRLWRLEHGGRVEQIFAHDDGHFAAVEVADDGVIYVGAGKGGRVYRVNPDGSHSTWIDVDERQVLGVDVDHPEPIIITGDAGAVYRVVQGPASERYWTSAALDAAFTSRWGQLTWRADGDITFQTRSGNTATPDDSWTDWSSSLTSPGPVRSPGARFIQVRADFRGDATAILRAVDLYYLPQNQHARVHSIRVETRTTASARITQTKGAQKAATKRSKARTASQASGASSRYKIRWKVVNPDQDRLRYRLRFRADGQALRRAMFTEDTTLTATTYNWETGGVPDGWYRIEVEASDELDNPEDHSIRAATESEPVLIDNHAPRIEGLRFSRGEVSGRVRDAVGPISRLEYAVDGGAWRQLHSEDGILDTAEESFRFGPLRLEPGSHIIAVRAADHGANQITAELEAVFR